MSNSNSGYTAQKSMEIKGSYKRLYKVLVTSKFPKILWLFLIPLYLINSINAVVVLWYPTLLIKISQGDLSEKTIAFAVGALVLESSWNLITGTFNQFIKEIFPKKYNEIVISKAMELPVSFYDKFNSRELLGRIRGDSAKFGDLVTLPIQFITTVQGLTLTLWLINDYHSNLFYYTIATIPLVGIFYLISARIMFYVNSREALEKSKIYRYVSDILRNVGIVKVFSSEEKEKKKAKKKFAEYKKAQNNIIFARVGYVNTTAIVVLGISFGAMLIGVDLIGDGSIAFGVWLAFYYLYTGIIRSFTTLFTIFITLRASQGALNFTTNVLELKSEDYSGIDVPKMSNIEFKNVTFQYNEEKEVLKNINLVLKKGEHTAIIGKSGSGKTTILTLLERLYNISNGSITMGNTNIDEFELNQWRRSFTYVTQSVTLYTGTIRSNILYGIKREVKDEEIFNILEKVNLKEFVEELEDGLDSEIGEDGKNFSGGERQRISLANAFLAESEFVLLDEATSNLDAESEHIILKTIKELSKTKTIISIAHRLSTIKSASKVIVLDNGVIESMGDLKEVQKNSKLFNEWFSEGLNESEGVRNGR